MALTVERREPRRGPGTTVASGSEACPAVPGSGDKQAKAKVCSVEIDEVAVAFGPPA